VAKSQPKVDTGADAMILPMQRLLVAYTAGLIALLALSAWRAHDTPTWVLEGADEFLGTQGDPWDTQKDMALAGIGALFAQWTLARWHDRQLQALPPPPRT
jgi:putative membrane protein